VASTDIIKSSQNDDKVYPKFIARYESEKLINDAELDVYTTAALTTELIIIFGFFLLRFIRWLIRSFIFAKWEETHGRDIYKIKKIQKPGEFVVVKKESIKAAELNQKLSDDAKKEEFELTLGKRILIKIYSLTYILEFILLCRLMNDIVLHTSFNITAVSFAKNTKSLAFLFNYAASCVALMIFAFEMVRFTRINFRFVKGVLTDKYTMLKIKKFNRLKKLFANTNK
jgi:hypothetical protein